MRGGRSYQLGSDTRQPIVFGSKSEAALALLMERFIPNWKAVAGDTVGIKVGVKIFDFRVDDLLIEYHPIVLDWEFKNKAALHRIKIALRFCPRHEAKAIKGALERELFAQYSKRRSDIARSCPEFSRFNVLCCADVGEFYEGVIAHYSETAVGFSSFEAEFKRTISGL